MSADAMQNELCGILERLNALPPAERDDLLGFLKCFLSPLDSVTTSLPTANPEYSVTHSDSAVFVSSTDNIDSVPGESNTVTNQDLNGPFILGGNLSIVLLKNCLDTLNLGFFVQTQEKSTNTPGENSQLVISESRDKQPENIKSKGKQEESIINSESGHDSCCASKHAAKMFPTSVLRCPVCWLGFSQWQHMENHLYKAHTTPVDPVCWRCQGVFDSHAVLLAHECFDWGRLHLPCQAILNGSSTTAKRQRALLANGSTFGYPPDGVFLKRRCGLCFKSNVVFNNFQCFQLHKRSVHTVTDESISNVRVHQRKRARNTKQMRNSANRDTASSDFIHPQSVDALRLKVRRLFDRFCQLQRRKSESKGQPACEASVDVDHTGVSSITPVAVCGEQKNGLNSAIASTSEVVTENAPETVSESPNCLTVDIDFNPSNESSFVSITSSRKRLQWRRKRRKSVRFKRALHTKAKQTQSTPYRKNHDRFCCQCCSAVFGVASRLRAHHLFKHGYIPESLGGLSPTPDETPNWTRLDDEVQSTASTENTTPTSKQDCTRMNLRSRPKRTDVGKSMLTTGCAQSKYACDELASTGTDPPFRLDMIDERAKIGPDGEGTIRQSGSKRMITRRRKMQSKPTSTLQDTDNSKSVTEDALVTDFASANTGRCPPFKCSHCERSYKSVHSLARHENQVHKGEYRYSCGYCAFRTNERFALDEHLARHFRLKQFVCDFCDARFVGRRALVEHIALKHNTARHFKCPMCPLTFKYSYSFLEFNHGYPTFAFAQRRAHYPHLINAFSFSSPPKPNPQTSGTLSRHRKIHGSRVLHECSFCPSKFTRLSNMRRHIAHSHRHRHLDSSAGPGETGPTRRGRKSVPRKLRQSDQSNVMVSDVTGCESQTLSIDSELPVTLDCVVPETNSLQSHFEENSPSAQPNDAHVGYTEKQLDRGITTECENATTGNIQNSLCDINTIFMPYLPDMNAAAPVAVQSSSSVTLSDQNNSMLISPSDAQSSFACSAPQTVYSGLTFTSLFPLQLVNQLSTSTSFTSGEQLGSHTWSSSAPNPVYILTTTSDSVGPHKNPDVLTNSAVDLHFVTLPMDNQTLSSDSRPCEKSFEVTEQSCSEAGLLCPSYPSDIPLNSLLNVTNISDTPCTGGVDLTHIWRPVECELSSPSSGRNITVVSDNNHIGLLPTYGHVDLAHDSTSPSNNDHSNSFDSSDAIFNCEPSAKPTDSSWSPRFPSPVSETMSPHSTACPSPPISQSRLTSYCSGRQSDQPSFLGDCVHLPRSQAVVSVSTGCESQASSSHQLNSCGHFGFPSDTYSNHNPIPVHLIVCNSDSRDAQFLSPIWSCPTPPESLQSYSNSLLSPSERHPDANVDQCSNFSVGYLIGQNSTYAPLGSSGDQLNCTLSTSTPSETQYYGFNTSVP
ncbi:hypothetical protein PHET_00782 [Paragonimus heterotremus]|uniref:C2H2-type domain-containing protein n=1 Tax=Paragonimus heterotremus TaxID=100268 RepID=A0A8J4TSB5_9TREM|nr:hypothetical protein PHET_00782 [Paragonimus heterotremus]